MDGFQAAFKPFLPKSVIQIISDIYHFIEGLPKSPPKPFMGFSGDILSVPCSK
jgi:hypothetical protein